tara:strand:+ start:274 stop:570 length:297 start_codon:yes stop_codon:yes gene_type:complete
MNKIKKIKPKLVDYSKLLKIEKPKKNISKDINNNNNNLSFYINILGLLILIIGGYCLYQRYNDKEETQKKQKDNIMKLNEYIQNYEKFKENYFENKIK